MSNLQRIIKLAYPHVKSVLDKICDKGKKMKRKDLNLLGCCKRSVTASDGCWIIRGFHSQCCAFAIVDFMSEGILLYGHLGMGGSNNICDTEFWQGTSKASEGHLAYVLFVAKEDGMVCEVDWQDQDSSSGS